MAEDSGLREGIGLKAEPVRMGLSDCVKFTMISSGLVLAMWTFP